MIGFGVMVPIAGLLADAFGRRKKHGHHYHVLLSRLFAFTPLLGSAIQLGIVPLLGLSLMG